MGAGVFALLANPVAGADGGAHDGGTADPGGERPVLSVYEARRQATGGTAVARWLDDGSSFYYEETAGGDKEIVLVDPARNRVEPLFDAARFARALAGLGLENAIGDVDFASMRLKSPGSTARFAIAGRAVELDLGSYEARYVVPDLPAGAQDDPALPRLAIESFPRTWADQLEIQSPDGRAFLGIVEHNVFVRSLTGEPLFATSDGTLTRPWQLRGAAWSPDGRKLVTFRMDTTGLKRLHIVDWNNPYDASETFVQGRSAGPLPTHSGAIFDRETGERLDFELGSEPYIRSLGWRSDSTEVFVAKLSRDAKGLEIVAVDASTGNQRTVLVEESDTFLYFPPNVMYREGVPFHLLRDNEHFVWGSERSGWMQFYLYSLNGDLLGRITEGGYPVVQFGGQTADGRRILYTASGNTVRPYDTQVYSAAVTGGQVRKLSDGPGRHEIQVSPSGEFYLVKHSTTATLPVTELRRQDGALVRVLSKATLPSGVSFMAPEHFTTKAADGTTDIHGVIFKPAGFDSRKPYPVVENIYAGPFVTYVPYRFDSRRPYYGSFLFEAGYVEVVIDGRGTPGRGKAFQDVVYRSLGRHEIADHATALVQAAESRPWMDMCRVGVFGNSYGGYFAVRALLQAPDVYDVAVAAGTPVRDQDDSAAATEAYIGPYRPDSKLWMQASNLPLLHHLNGKLLLIQGTSDVNTPLHGSFKIADGLIQAGKQFDMLVLPNVNHHYHGAGFSRRAYMEQSIVRYFDEHLKPGYSESRQCAKEATEK